MTGQAAISHPVTRPSTPTASLYLENACAGLLRSEDIRRLSPTVFTTNKYVIVVRHMSGLRRLPSDKKLIYVIDDDWRAGIKDTNLPWVYRVQLANNFAYTAPSLERRAVRIVVSSEVLASRYRTRYPAKPVSVLEPVWPEPQTQMASTVPKSFAYLSAWSHSSDFLLVRDAIENVLRSDPHLRFTVSKNAPIPLHWATMEQIEIVPRLSWHDYRKWLKNKTFDVVLYPTLATAFNSARSASKLGEVDQFGAAAIVSDTHKPTAKAAAAGRCFPAENKSDAWEAALTELLSAPRRARSIAMQNRRTLRRGSKFAKQRMAWARLLEL